MTGLEAVADARTAELFALYCDVLRSQRPRKKRAARAAKVEQLEPPPMVLSATVDVGQLLAAANEEKANETPTADWFESEGTRANADVQAVSEASPQVGQEGGEQLEHVPALSVIVARSRASRKDDGRMRGGTIAGRLTRAERQAASLIIYPDVDRPATRGDCHQAPGPCPFVSCKWHLYLDVNEETGAIKFNFPDKDVDELVQTCALDVADEGPHHLEAVGDLINATRERVRQIEAAALVGGRESAAAFGVCADD